LKNLLTILVLTTVISACSTTRHWRKELEKTWIGKTKDELVSKRGKPDQINSSDVKGTDIYIYIKTDFTPDIPPNNYSEDFFVNGKGIIYKIETYRW